MYGNKVYVQIPSNSCCNAGCYQTRHLCYQTRHNIIFKLFKSCVWLKMVQYSAVYIRTHHQSAADHHLTLYNLLCCQNVLFGNIPFDENQT